MFQGENKNKMKTKNPSSCPFCKVNTAQVLMPVSFWPNEVVAQFQKSYHFTSNYHNTVNYTDPNQLEWEKLFLIYLLILTPNKNAHKIKRLLTKYLE